MLVLLLNDIPVYFSYNTVIMDKKASETVNFINLDNVKKQYRSGDVVTNALRGVSFDISEGEFAVIVGPSGAGKTTVLNLLGGMEALTSGTITVAGKCISGFSLRELTAYRRFDIGFVFQFYNLIQNLTALENVELASQISRDPLDAAKILDEVGLNQRKNNFPAQLSGGEQQRVAIARALAKNPKLLLCDEPTGALDYSTGKGVLHLLQDTCRKKGITVIVITHNQAITPMADKIIHIKNGVQEKIDINHAPKSVEEIEW
jgi:putative ABC transport system ATP-binding protein